MSNTRINYVVYFLFFIYSSLSAQQRRICAVGQKDTPKTWEKYSQFERFLLRHQSERSLDSTTLIRIPVVVHVIHSEVSRLIGLPESGNISDAQILSQIKVLNDDYRNQMLLYGQTKSTQGVDTKIEFYLATKDPDGFPTSGIQRVFSPQKTFDVFDDNFTLSALSYWDSSRYLNIWVTKLKNNYIGLGEFPGGDLEGLEVEDVDARIDGVIIDHTVFGKQIGTVSDEFYGYGRTLTHEVGHWLGLIHTWGDQFCGTDFVEDTPPTESPNQTLFCRPTFSFCDGTRTLNMTENFMDYTPDSCMNTFTPGQRDRLRLVLELSERRKRLVDNSLLANQLVENPEMIVLNNPGSLETLAIQLLVPGYQDFTLRFYNSVGQLIQEEKFNQSPSIFWRPSRYPVSWREEGVIICQWEIGEQIISKRILIF
ncbi:MAG: zinc metalloprotease [Spirosomataceae bacterium]